MQVTLDVGTRIRRAGQRWKTYRVVSIRSPTHHPPHAQLIAESRECDTITVSVQTLVDTHYWQPVV